VEQLQPELQELAKAADKSALDLLGHVYKVGCCCWAVLRCAARRVGSSRCLA
jgi:hypothetical protein